MDPRRPRSCLCPSLFLCGANLTQVFTPPQPQYPLCGSVSISHPHQPHLTTSPHIGNRGEPAISLFCPEEGVLTSFSHICSSSGHYPSVPRSGLLQRLNRTARPCHLAPLSVLLSLLLTGQTHSALLNTSQRYFLKPSPLPQEFQNLNTQLSCDHLPAFPSIPATLQAGILCSTSLGGKNASG